MLDFTINRTTIDGFFIVINHLDLNKKTYKTISYKNKFIQIEDKLIAFFILHF